MQKNNFFLVFLMCFSVSALIAQNQASFTSPIKVCENSPITFRSNSVVNGTSIVEYAWDFDGNATFDLQSTVDTATFIYNADTLSKKYGGQHVFNVQLRVVTALGDTLFSNKRSIKVNYIPVLTNSSTSHFDSVACKLDTLKFFNNYFVSEGTVVNTYWYFNNEDETYTQTYFKRTFTQAGLYTVKTIAITDNNCKNTSEGSIRIKEIPNGIISYSGETTFYNDKNITLSVAGDFSAVKWNTNESTPSIVVNSSGVYTATLTNIEQCVVDVSSSLITVLEEKELQATNMMTLNDDAKNEAWKILEIEAYGVCEVHVFNRNGSEVFSSMDYKNDWTGKDASGTKIPAGTYYYTIKASELAEVKKGTINILH